MLDYFEVLLYELQIGPSSAERSANTVLYLPEHLNVFKVTLLHQQLF